MTKNELVAILLSHSLAGVPDPEIRIATGAHTSLSATIEYVTEDDGYGPHILLRPTEDQE